MSYPLTIEIKNINAEQVETNKNAFDLDLTKLATIIASAVATSNPITTPSLPPFSSLDIKSYLHSIITQLTYTTYFLPLLNSSQSFVSLLNAKLNPTVYYVLYTQLTKTIPNLIMKILNLKSTSKSGVEILVLLQAKILMSKSANDIDTLYKNWWNMDEDSNEYLEDYTTRIVRFKKYLQGTEKELKRPEFIRKWRQGFGEIVAPINLVIYDLSQDPSKWRDDAPQF